MFQAPPGDTLGEMQGVATNSKGYVFAFFRGPTTRLWEFDPSGKFVKEIGKGFYGFMFAHSVRVDRHDNIWTVDEGTNVVTKFDPTGTKVLMILGHRPDMADGPYATPTGHNLPDQKYTFCRPTDVAWDPAGNIFVSDHLNGGNRILSRHGRYVLNRRDTTGLTNILFEDFHAASVDRASLPSTSPRQKKGPASSSVLVGAGSRVRRSKPGSSARWTSS